MNSVITEMLRSDFSPAAIAVACGTTVQAIVAIMVEVKPGLGWGRPENYGFIVSRKKVWDRRWPELDSPALAQCRKDHDAGRTTMMQARDGDYIIQYSFPIQTAVPLPRTKWFTAPQPTY